MSSPCQQFVPKVHPLDRGIEEDDPLELVANPVQGDPGVMLECFAQEFLGLGWEVGPLLALFQSPVYPVPHQLCEYFGAAEVERRLHALAQRTGVFRVKEIIEEIEETSRNDERLVQLYVARAGSPITPRLAIRENVTTRPARM